MNNKEIKFRAWDNINNVMELDVQLLCEFSTMLWKDKYNIMQYTGLLDKNGKEIYEGDIMTSPLGATFGVVSFREGAFVLNQGQDALGRDKFDWLRMINHGCEIIGSIYENPELIKA